MEKLFVKLCSGVMLAVMVVSFVWGQASTIPAGSSSGSGIATPGGSPGQLQVNVAGTSLGGRDLPCFSDDGTSINYDSAQNCWGQIAGNNTWTGHQMFPANTAQPLVAATAIVADRLVVVVNTTGSANVTTTAVPTVAAGSDGQGLCIINGDTVDTVTLQDNDTLVGSLLELPSTTLAMAPKSQHCFRYNSALLAWLYQGSSGGATSPLSTKGDLYGFDTAGNRLPVGANWTILAADSTAAMGVAYKDLFNPTSSDFYSNNFRLKDEMTPGNGTGNSGYGELGWRMVNNTGSNTVVMATAETNHPYVLDYATTTTSASIGYLSLGIGNIGGIPNLGAGGAWTAWRATYLVKSDSAVTDYHMGVGFANAGGVNRALTTGSAFGIKGDSSATTCDSVAPGNANGTAGEFVVWMRGASGTTFCVDTNVVLATDTWYRFDFVSTTLGTVTVSINGVLAGTLTGDIPTNGQIPFMLLGNSVAGTSVRHLYVDYFGFLGTGLSR